MPADMQCVLAHGWAVSFSPPSPGPPCSNPYLPTGQLTPASTRARALVCLPLLPSSLHCHTFVPGCITSLVT